LERFTSSRLRRLTAPLGDDSKIQRAHSGASLASSLAAVGRCGKIGARSPARQMRPSVRTAASQLVSCLAAEHLEPARGVILQLPGDQSCRVGMLRDRGTPARGPWDNCPKRPPHPAFPRAARAAPPPTSLARAGWCPGARVEDLPVPAIPRALPGFRWPSRMRTRRSSPSGLRLVRVPAPPAPKPTRPGRRKTRTPGFTTMTATSPGLPASPRPLLRTAPHLEPGPPASFTAVQVEEGGRGPECERAARAPHRPAQGSQFGP